MKKNKFVSQLGIVEESNGRCRNRTCDPLIKSQLPENDNLQQNKDLQKDQNIAYKPAYKQNHKKQANLAENLPNGLVEIIAVWPELPEHIKAAIKALVQTYIEGKKTNGE